MTIKRESWWCKFQASPLALIACGLEKHVDMRMRLIGMQSHHIAMLESKLLPGDETELLALLWKVH
jgi:hypothetical protein